MQQKHTHTKTQKTMSFDYLGHSTDHFKTFDKHLGAGLSRLRFVHV